MIEVVVRHTAHTDKVEMCQDRVETNCNIWSESLKHSDAEIQQTAYLKM